MKRFCMFLAMLAIVTFATAAQANLLTDGSVEDVPLNTAWTLTANAPDGTEASAVHSTSVWAASDGDSGIWFKSFEGNQAMGDSTANADITQSVSAPQNGDYTLLFDSARETNFTAGSATASLSSSGTGGTDSIDLLTATYNDGGNMESDPTKFTLMLSGVTAGDTLTVSVAMVDGVDAGANPQSLMVDNFNLFVPEPTSIALAGMSLLSLLGTGRRR